MGNAESFLGGFLGGAVGLAGGALAFGASAVTAISTLIATGFGAVGGHIARQLEQNHPTPQPEGPSLNRSQVWCNNQNICTEGYKATDGTVFVDFTDIRPGSLDVFLCLAVKTNGAGEPLIHAGIAFKANNMAIKPSWKSNKWNAVLIHRLGNGLALDVRDSMDDFAQTLQGPISADKYGFIHVGSVNSGLLCNGTAVMSADLQRNFGIRGFRENPRGQTHCVAFAIRLLKGLGLQVSQYQMTDACHRMGLSWCPAAAAGLSWQEQWSFID